MKYQILTLAFAASALAAQADDLSLYLEPTAGATSGYEVSSLQKMTFSDGNVVLTKKDGTAVSTAISTIKRMYFDQTATAINQLLGQTTAPYTIYNINGVRVGEGSASCFADINLQNLQHGLYIVTIQNQNFKIVK